MNELSRDGHRQIRRIGRRMRPAAAFLGFALICASPLFGSSPSSILRGYDHDSWHVRDGLPGDDIEAIARTQDGYLWLGTGEGLVRFDGVRFARLDELSKTSPRTGIIGSLLGGRDGCLWIGTRSGMLYRWKDGALAPYGPAEGFGRGVRALLEGDDGSLWVGTWGAGLFRLRAGFSSQSFTNRNGLPSNEVFAIRQDRDGDTWIATRGGLVRWHDDAITAYTRKDGLLTDQAFSLGAGNDGDLWVGAIGGLARWKDGGFQTFGRNQGAPNAAFFAMAAEPDGTLWIGTKGGGLTRFSHGSFETAVANDVLASDIVLSIFRDRERSVWVGTLGGGLHRFKPKAFVTYDHDDGLPTNTVSSVLQDSAGDIWVGTRGNGSGDVGGLARLHDGVWTTYGKRQGLASNRVASLFQDKRGVLWVGGAGGGLARLQEGRIVTVVRSDNAPGNNGILAMTEDRDGNLWYGTGRGALYQIRNGRPTPVALSDNLRIGRIHALLSGRDGSVWIGTNGGLFRWKEGHATAYSSREGLPAPGVQSLYEDARGVLWIGTRGGGLGRLANGRIGAITSREGLCGDVIFQILEDEFGSIWLSGRNGVCRVRKSELETVSLGKSHAIHATHYGAAAGIPNGACSGAAQPAGWRDRDGRLWFTTDSGVTFVDPRAEVPVAPPSVRIETVLGDQRPLDPRNLRLEPGTRHLSIRYTALYLLDPSRLQFRYRLEGWDEGWVEAGARRTAEYLNLPVGSYRFRVAAGNGDGNWNESAMRLFLTVAPHFYQTAWFAGLCAAAAIGAAWALHRARLRQLRNRFGAVLEERARLARDVHDTLAQGFTAILLHLESVSATLSSSPEVARHHIDRVRQTARRSLAEARRAVWDLRRRSSKEGGLAATLSDFIAGTTPQSPTSIQIRSRGVVRPIPGAVEEELERLGQEAISNALHHAEARTIRVGIAYEREAIRLTVSDDGRGFDPALAPLSRGHFGLIGMRERTQRLRGRLTLRSRSGRGTIVSIRVPLDSEVHSLRLALKPQQPIGGRIHDETSADSRSAG